MSSEEVGALQGAADTARTVAAMLGAPLFAFIFARCIERGRAQEVLRAMAAMATMGLLCFVGVLGKASAQTVSAGSSRGLSSEVVA